MNRISWGVALGALILCGCGDGVDSVAPVEAPEETTELDFRAGPLVIPMAPRTHEDVHIIAKHDEAGALTAKHAVWLALGGVYPTEFTAKAAGLYLPGCWDVEGELRFDAVAVTGDAIAEVRISDESSVVFEPTSEGDANVMVTGVFRFVADCGEVTAGTELPLNLLLTLRTREIVGVDFRVPNECKDQESLLVEARAPLHQLVLYPRDRDGEAFYPGNAQDNRPIDIRVSSAASDVTFALDPERPGVAGLVVNAPTAAAFEVASDFDDALAMTVVPASAVTGMDIAFPILGMGGGGVTLEYGKTYGETGWARTSDTIGPTAGKLYVDGVALCTRPRPESFQLASATPERCYVEYHDGGGDYYTWTPVGKSARVIEAGLCELTVTAPAFANGEGLTAAMSATILNIDSMIETPSR